jgi:hypothetical protein
MRSEHHIGNATITIQSDDGHEQTFRASNLQIQVDNQVNDFRDIAGAVHRAIGYRIFEMRGGYHGLVKLEENNEPEVKRPPVDYSTQPDWGLF